MVAIESMLLRVFYVLGFHHLKPQSYFSPQGKVPYNMVIVYEEKQQSHSFAMLASMNEMALSLICLFIIPTSFMLEQTTWNSFNCLLEYSLSIPLKVGRKCISPNLSSKAISRFRYRMHRSYYSKLGATSSLSMIDHCHVFLLRL